jgi:hypothetical protein
VDLAPTILAGRLAKVIKFDNVEHGRYLADWLKLRGMSAEGSTNLPELGLILIDTGCPVAVGFLRRVEGNYALLDSLCTNPAVLPEIRDKSLDYLVKELIKLARREGITAITATSVDPNTLTRSLKHGFIAQPHTTITLVV